MISVRFHAHAHSLFNEPTLTGNELLTEADRDNIRAFNLRLKTNMSRENYNEMRQAFSHKLEINSLYITTRRIALLADLKPQYFDCCINSCVCYTREYSGLNDCPYCQEPRFSSSHQPRRRFCYLPVVPRFKAFFQSADMIEKLRYRPDFHYDPNNITDIFSSSRYQEMLHTVVRVDGEPLGHRFFSDSRDIAFGLCTDGFLLFNRKRGGPSATPLLLKIYSLPPSIRTHLEHLLCLGVIPGPHQPKDLASFLAPFDDECADLAHGIPCYDCSLRDSFNLHAYQITEEGDIIAIEKFLGLKGHSSLCPCRSCKMRGCRMATGSNKVYYIPLAQPVNNEGRIDSWDPATLPLRIHKEFEAAMQQIEAATTKKYQRELEQYHGIKQRPALRRVNALDYARSCPWEWLHLFAENLVPNMLDIWTGRFKGQDEGSGEYLIDAESWSQIGQETEEAVKDIPSSFVRALGNIAMDRAGYTAESYAFWFMYLAPHLLLGRFRNMQYYDHAMGLVDIMKTTLQFSLTTEEVDVLEVKCRNWALKYEE